MVMRLQIIHSSVTSAFIIVFYNVNPEYSFVSHYSKAAPWFLNVKGQKKKKIIQQTSYPMSINQYWVILGIMSKFQDHNLNNFINH